MNERFDRYRRMILLSGAAWLTTGGGRLSATIDPERADAASRSTIFVFLYGGLSQLDSFDPKPDASIEYRGEFESSQTPVPGVRLCEHLPRLSLAMDRFSIIRSISHPVADHGLAARYILSGTPLSSSGMPGIGAYLSANFGWSIPPQHVAIPGIEPTAGLLGARHEAKSLLGDTGAMINASSRLTSGEPARQWSRRKTLRDRLSLSNGEQFTSAGEEARKQAIELVESKKIRTLLNQKTISEQERKLYGNSSFGTHLVLARRMAEAGSRFVAVRKSGFDTHSNNFETLSEALPVLDHGLAGLFEDLQERGLLETTSVVVTTEFGRSPEINELAGRDHWPRAASYLVSGGGLVTGQVVGETDSIAGEPKGQSIRPDDIAATILHLHGLDTKKMRLPGTTARVLPQARLATELLESAPKKS